MLNMLFIDAAKKFNTQETIKQNLNSTNKIKFPRYTVFRCVKFG